MIYPLHGVAIYRNHQAQSMRVKVQVLQDGNIIDYFIDDSQKANDILVRWIEYCNGMVDKPPMVRIEIW